MGDDVIDRVVEFIFSKDVRKFLIPLFIIGLVLRILIAFRSPFSADEMVHGPHAIGFISSGKLQIMDQDAVWFWLTDLAMNLFGVNAFGMRLPAIFFGSLSILVLYGIGKELFEKRVGIFAALVFALSPLQLLMTVGVMDIAMAFFAFFALYLFILSFKTGKRWFFLLTWISLGIAIMMKQIAVLFLPAFALFHLFYHKKYYKSLQLRGLVYAGFIVVLMVAPVLVFNYLLYKDKGILDLQFARFTRLSFDAYSSIGSTIESFSFEKLLFNYNNSGVPGFLLGFRVYYDHETLIALLFALLGLYFFSMAKHPFFLLLILSFLFPFLFLSGVSLLPNHMVFGTSFIALFAGLAITRISEKIRSKKVFFILVIIIFLVSLGFAMEKSHAKGILGKNELHQMILFKDRQIGKDALVIVDSRIYRGRIVFMFWDRHYIEASLFSQLLQEQEKAPGDPLPLETYFIEAVSDDSGWGTVKDQPEFNASMESMVVFFKNNSQLIGSIDDIHGERHFNIYRQTFSFKPSLLPVVDATHQWFFYPVAYQPASQVFDNYTTKTAFDAFLDKIAHGILYLEVVLALLSPFLLFYCLYQDFSMKNDALHHHASV